jgi:hypothetical protein
MFPRFLFSPNIIDAIGAPPADDKESGNDTGKDPAKVSSDGNLDLRVVSHASVDQTLIQQFPKRSYLQILKPWVYYPQNRTGFWQYFRRPFFLWGFPNVVIVCHHCKTLSHFPPQLTDFANRPALSSPSAAQPESSPSTPSPRSSPRPPTTSAPPLPASSSSPP